MTHEEAMNIILSNACPAEVNEVTGINVYAIELHCARFEVMAKPLGNFRYEIKEVKRV